MKLVFLGTRGEIEKRSKRHQFHSVLMIASGRKRIVLDWGLDWLNKLDAIHPDAIVLTHAHPDHAGGLRGGASCPVHATDETWQRIGHYPVPQRSTVYPGKSFMLYGIELEAFPVEHSLIAPAVGYRICSGHVCFVYLPDVVSIPGRTRVLAGVQIYIGDGAAISRSLIRRRAEWTIGHSSIANQLSWCREENVPRAVFTHCGSEIVGGDERQVERKILRLSEKHQVKASIAHDGLILRL